LPAGSLVVKFHSIQEEDVGPALEMADEARRVPTRDSRGPVSEYLVDLYGDACVGCESKQERLVVTQLLSEYKDVFSCGDHDMSLAKAVCHEIPLAEGTVLIRQPTRWLGPEKEKEVSQQVQELGPDCASPWCLELSSCPGSERGWELEVVPGLSQTEQRDHSGCLPSS